MTTFDTDIVLGERYRDTYSGYEGVATSVVFYLNGCERVQLETLDESSRELRENYFDAPRLTHVASGVQAKSERTGGVKPAPPARSAARTEARRFSVRAQPCKALILSAREGRSQAMPETIVRCSAPRSMLSLSNRSVPSTRSAASTVATRRSSVLK